MEINFHKGVVFAFDKPYEWTSFGIVARMRRMISEKLGGEKIKVGHAGTLDPLATGVVIVCTGRGTRLIDELQSGVKEYTATLRLGATTPSFDLEHEIDARFPTAHITLPLIESVLPRFVGEIMQVPPAFSACKIEGKRAYDLARKGKEVELKAKPLRIDTLELLSFDASEMLLTLRIVCSKGTYIRALARDIGEALGSGAHLTALHRSRVGDFGIDDCYSFDTFAQMLDAAEVSTQVPENQSISRQKAEVEYLHITK